MVDFINGFAYVDAFGVITRVPLADWSITWVESDHNKEYAALIALSNNLKRV